MSFGARIHSHSRQDLVAFVNQNAVRLDYRTHIRANQLYRALLIGHISPSVILFELGNIFDEFFFGGLLAGRCHIAFSPMPSSASSYYGYTTQNRPGTAEVVLFIRDLIEDPLTRLRGYISTLLHELAHAFLYIYQCRHCFAEDVAPGKHRNPGHGWSFQAIVRAIERACNAGNVGAPPLDVVTGNTYGQ
ncbi:hypothetical protein BDZ45DRAFT_742629 [Acephala macrosclerotiorum]|nr:hypothetical protein BDZ45DRAFT_742629 [Acephala macrosclerotiorum]